MYIFGLMILLSITIIGFLNLAQGVKEKKLFLIFEGLILLITLGFFVIVLVKFEENKRFVTQLKPTIKLPIDRCQKIEFDEKFQISRIPLEKKGNKTDYLLLNGDLRIMGNTDLFTVCVIKYDSRTQAILSFHVK